MNFAACGILRSSPMCKYNALSLGIASVTGFFRKFRLQKTLSKLLSQAQRPILVRFPPWRVHNTESIFAGMRVDLTV